MTRTTPPATKPGAGRRILLVEDNEAANKGLARLLQAQGFAVTAVQDGASALAAFASAEPPDFVLTDLQLPDIDGREVALHARALDPRPRVMLITGWDVESELGDPAVSGIDCVLPKPVDFRDLLARLTQPPRGPGG